MKIAHLVWLPKLFHNYSGLGDLLRGTISSRHIAERVGYRLIVHLDRHPIKKFLDQDLGVEIQQLTDDIKINVFLEDEELETDLKKFEGTDFWFFTTCTLNYLVNDEDRIFIRQLIKPKPEYESMLNKIKSTLPTDYGILHFRFDDRFYTDHSKTDILLKKVTRAFNRFKHDSSYLMVCCNIPAVKEKLPEDMPTLPGKPAHLGLSLDDESNLDTLIEFWIIANSNLIWTHSDYFWRSGFIDWISRINGIPVIDIYYLK